MYLTLVYFIIFLPPQLFQFLRLLLDCWFLQMPMRSGRRRGASEERRGRRPHASPTRPERSDRQTVRAVPLLALAIYWIKKGTKSVH